MKMMTLPPAEPRTSTYNIDPRLLRLRAANLPGLTSVRIAELFPDSPEPISATLASDVRKTIRERTLQQLERVDLSMIQPEDTVNVLASHHGFTIQGGEAYAEMIRVVRDEVERRCGTKQIRLRAGNGLRFRESEEYIKRFGLDQDDITANQIQDLISQDEPARSRHDITQLLVGMVMQVRLGSGPQFVQNHHALFSAEHPAIHSAP